MKTPSSRSIIAGFVALAILLVAHWFDAGVLADAQVRFNQSYDPTPLFQLSSIARILTVTAVLAIVLAGRWSKEPLLGIGYAVVGGLLVFLPTLTWTFAISVNGKPAVLPQSIAGTVTSWNFALSTGVTGAVFTIGAAMLIVGIAVVGSSLMTRPGSGDAPISPAAPESDQGPA